MDWIAYHGGPYWNWFMIHIGGPVGWAMIVAAPIGFLISVRQILAERRSSQTQGLQSSPKSSGH